MFMPAIILVGFLIVFTGCKVETTDDGNGDDEPPTGFYVSTNGSDSNDGSQGTPWGTIQYALDQLEPGHTLTIMPGSYDETLYMNRSGTAAMKIHIKGQSYDTTLLDGSNADRDLFFVEGADYIEISDLTITHAPRAALRLSNSNNVEIRNCLIADNGTWGIFTDFSDDTTISNCDVFGSGEEHGIYISNSSDRATIRNSLVHHNHASGIQINADPSMGGDGISSDCLIENNLIYENGWGGGAAINLASVRDSTVWNNIVVYNYAGGIAGWDDGQGRSWGCKDLTIIHNTIYFRPMEGRWALSLKNGSTGAAVYNNILAGGARGGFEFNTNVLSGLEIDYNIYYRFNSLFVVLIEGVDEFSMVRWQSMTHDSNSFMDNPQDLFIDAGGGNFHLDGLSGAIDAGIDVGLDHDFEGDVRPQGAGPDIGADENS